MKCSLDISNFLEEISNLSHSTVFTFSLFLNILYTWIYANMVYKVCFQLYFYMTISCLNPIHWTVYVLPSTLTYTPCHTVNFHMHLCPILSFFHCELFYVWISTTMLSSFGFCINMMFQLPSVLLFRRCICVFACMRSHLVLFDSMWPHGL